VLRSRENESSAIALYIRLARVLREQISQGHWRPGDRLPTVEQLSSERGVSRVTVRQAVALLVKEGLLLSSRGRGIVVARTAFLPIDDPGLRLAINDRYGLAAGQRIRVLSRGRCNSLPPELSLEIGVTTGFSRIRKVHLHNGLPFAYLDSYVPQEIYDLFPRGSDKKLKIQRLIRDAGIDIHVARQEVTLTHATPEVAALLDCAMGAALVRLRSWRFDKSGRIVYAAANLYRGDLFVLDFVEEQSDRKPLPWLTPLTRYR
jgi:GntR family transcriptional regulator